MQMTDESTLFRDYKASGDRTIRNKIAEKYLYIAEIIAKKFSGRGVDYDDLFQVASVALIRGIDRFDAEKGLKFSTFITPTITGEVKNYFRDKSRLVKVPRTVTRLAADIRKKSDEFFARENRQPTVGELAKELQTDEESIVAAMEAGHTVSLDLSPNDDNSTLYDLIPDQNDSFEALENRDFLASALKSLSEVEGQLIRYRFAEGLSQQRTSEKLGVSQMFVSRLERKILQKLRSMFQEP